MQPRLTSFGNPLAGKILRHINSAGKVASESGVPVATQEPVKIRASQINACGFSTDMHTKDATVTGDTPLRLNLVATCREATVFTDAERAALELAEQGTRTADAAGGATDEAWENAAQTTARTNASRSSPSSPPSTPATASTSSTGSPPEAVSPAGSADGTRGRSG